MDLLTGILVAFAVLEGTALQSHALTRTEKMQCIQESRTVYDQCTVQLDTHFSDVSNTSVIPIFTEDKLTLVCQEYMDADQCVRQFLNRCTAVYAYYFNIPKYIGFNDSYHFLCNQARTDYLSHRQCYNQTQLTQADYHCMLTYNNKIDALATSRDPYYLQETFCQLINDYLRCVEEAATRLCDVPAALWLRELITKNLEPVYRYSLLGCTLDKSGYLYFQPNISSSTVTLPPSGGSNVPSTSSASSSTAVSSGVKGDPNNAKKSSGKLEGISDTALIAGIISLAFIGLGIISILVFKYFYDKKKERSRPRPRSYLDQRHQAVTTVTYQTGSNPVAIAFGASADCLPEKYDSAAPGSTPVAAVPLNAHLPAYEDIGSDRGVMGNPATGSGRAPPLYDANSHPPPIGESRQTGSDVDRNNVLSPPPPYAENYLGVINPAYLSNDQSGMSSVDG